MTRIPIDCIVIGAAIELIIAAGAVNRVIARQAPDHIIARCSGETRIVRIIAFKGDALGWVRDRLHLRQSIRNRRLRFFSLLDHNRR